MTDQVNNSPSDQKPSDIQSNAPEKPKPIAIDSAIPKAPAAAEPVPAAENEKERKQA